MRGIVVRSFGPFDFDPEGRRLFRGKKPVPLSNPQAVILDVLTSRPGVVNSKERLIDVAWEGAPITDNSLDKAISDLRKRLGDRRRDARYIQTIPHQGYRFTAHVQHTHRDTGEVPLDAQLARFAAFSQGRMELDSLDRDMIQRTRCALEETLRERPDYAAAEVRLAMACGLLFEASTPESQPDIVSLKTGIRHAQHACESVPASGEAWSTLAFLFHLDGNARHAAAAVYKAMELEPEDWLHALLAAYIGWGEERLRAARRVLALCPGLALAHWLRATVFIARGAFQAALDELRLGCAAQDAQAKGSPFPAVGLHLLNALVLAVHGRLDDAMRHLERELSWANSGQLYARECAANTWYAVGAIRLRQRQRAEADAAFARGLAISPRHVPAAAILRGEAPPLNGLAKSSHYLDRMDAATGAAIVFARSNRHAEAARVYREAVMQAPPGLAGWLLPVEPVLNPAAHGEIWSDVLKLIAVRAT